MINNTFPEIVQLLSKLESEGGVSEIKFEKIATIILGLLDKEKSQESLVERLVQIIRDTDDPITVRNSLLCINQLCRGEKVMNILCNQVEILKGKITLQGVEDLLVLILKKIRKNVKINKSLVTEFERCLF